MKLSIIIPVYNMAGDDKLKYCMDSLVNQTISDYEIIAVDDASTDDSLTVLKQYEADYPGLVKVIAQSENKKQGAAKNAALDICQGEYIGFMDADDWGRSDMYELLVKKAEETDADIVACDLVITDKHSMEFSGEPLAGIPEGITGEMTDDKFRLAINNSGYMVVKIYKRHIFESPKLRFPEKMFYEDNAIGLEVIHRAKRIEYVKEPLYYYYQHESSTVHVVNEERCNFRMEAMRILMKYVKEGSYLEPFHDEIEYKFFNLFYQNTLFSYMQGSQKKKLSFIKMMGKEMKETFPDFQKNPIYISKVNAEEKKLIAMQQKCTWFFVLYYKLLYTYRKIRYKKNN